MSISKIVARGGCLTALALIFSYIEILIPINFGIPGIKLGLANLVIMIGIYLLSPKEVVSISIARITLVGFLFGNMAAIMYSLSGAIVSFIVMLIVKKTNKLSILGVSITGGVCHNIAQLVVAMLVVTNINLVYYAPTLIIAGAVAGLIVGVIGEKVISVVSKFDNNKKRQKI